MAALRLMDFPDDGSLSLASLFLTSPGPAGRVRTGIVARHDPDTGYLVGTELRD